MRACWLKWVGRDWSISADYIWLNYSDANIISHFGLEATPKVGDYPRSILPGKSNLLSGKPDPDLYIGANESLSKQYAAGSLHYAKVFPREMSPLHANSASFISKPGKTAGHGYIDTPGTVYLEVFVDSPQGCIVLSFSFAGAAVQKTKEPADT